MANSRRTWLHDYATESYFAAPDDIARLGLAAAAAVHEEAPTISDMPEGDRAMASRIAAALMQAKRPLIIAGTGAGSLATIEAAANLAWALHEEGKEVRLSFVLPECNSLGLAMMGGQTLEGAFALRQNGQADTAIVLENDLYRRAGEEEVTAFLATLRGLIVLDSLDHRTTDRAHVVLPAATVPESDGTMVSSEGRAQRYYQVFVPDEETGASWRWLRELARVRRTGSASDDDLAALKSLTSWQDLDDVIAA